mmetsp:Transcript_1486/g.1485  ORF Transcript_1486/g.1485 Transcript_1486/m.1485 type:complete len:177 (+) Transcript_1486:33-563(+)
MEFIEETKQIKLISSDNEEFEISDKAAKLSNVILDQLEEDGGDQQEIPLPNIRGQVLALVVSFLNHYQTEPMTKIIKPLRSSDLSTLVQPWYFEFIRGKPEKPFDLEYISELILAANFMSIGPLLELSGAAFASQVRDKESTQLKELFGFEGELVPVDEKQIREENPWALEAPTNS